MGMIPIQKSNKAFLRRKKHSVGIIGLLISLLLRNKILLRKIAAALCSAGITCPLPLVAGYRQNSWLPPEITNRTTTDNFGGKSEPKGSAIMLRSG